MASLTKAGVATTYSYNTMGQRVRKFASTGTSSTLIFVYDQGGQLLGEYDQAGTAIREYVWLGSTPIAVFTPDPANSANPPLVYYIHADHLDAPRVVLDKNNGLRWRWMAEPFGTTAPETNPGGLGAFTQNLRFPGQYADAESGLSYNYFRDYDSSTGRYVQSDPIGLQGGINTYAYVGGNPISFVDPLGLKGASGGWGGQGLQKPVPPMRPDGQPWGAGCGDAKSDRTIPDLFPRSCAAHDQCYAAQCGKALCDSKFLSDMHRERGDIPAMPWLYYRAVDVFGDAAYKAAGKP
ncbi:MAG: RHS repeat-associated core domain-containing protein [Burkholderiaceae bacterium]